MKVQVQEKKTVCPACGSGHGVIPIVYGVLSEELRRNQREGKILVGGLKPGTVNRHCKGCGHQWAVG
jgi:hypothetical protein